MYGSSGLAMMMMMMDSTTGIVYWVPAEAAAAPLAPITPYRLVHPLAAPPPYPPTPGGQPAAALVLNTTVFVRGIPWEATTQTVESHFKIYGAIETCHVIRHKDASTNKGIAFVKFHDAAAAQRAVDCNNPGVMDRREIYAEYARPKASAGGKPKHGNYENPPPWHGADRHAAPLPTPPLFLASPPQLMSTSFFPGNSSYYMGAGPSTTYHLVNTGRGPFCNPVMAVAPAPSWIVAPSAGSSSSVLPYGSSCLNFSGGHVLGYPHPGLAAADSSWRVGESGGGAMVGTFVESSDSREVPSRATQSWSHGGFLYSPTAYGLPAAAFMHQGVDDPGSSSSSEWRDPPPPSWSIGSGEEATVSGSCMGAHADESWSAHNYHFETHDASSTQTSRQLFGSNSATATAAPADDPKSGITATMTLPPPPRSPQTRIQLRGDADAELMLHKNSRSQELNIESLGISSPGRVVDHAEQHPAPGAADSLRVVLNAAESAPETCEPQDHYQHTAAPAALAAMHHHHPHEPRHGAKVSPESESSQAVVSPSSTSGEPIDRAAESTAHSSSADLQDSEEWPLPSCAAANPAALPSSKKIHDTCRKGKSIMR